MLRRLGESLLRDSARASSEHAELPGLCRRLRSLPAPLRAAAIDGDPSFHRYSFGAFLVEESCLLAERDVAEARRLAALAVAVSERVREADYGAFLVLDLQARAWAAVAAVSLGACELAAAAEALARCEALLGDADGDDLELARVLELKAALRREQQRFRQAHGLIDDAISLYHRYRDPGRIGGGLLAKAEIHIVEGDLEAAVRALRRGLSLIEVERDPERWLGGRCRLVGCLADVGRTEEAWFLLEALRDRVRGGSSQVGLQFTWSEGKVCRAQGRVEEAKRCLTAARDGYVESQRWGPAVAVCLDLAGLFAECGQLSEMRDVARAILPLARSRALPRQALAATLILEKAGRVESLSGELLAVFGRRRPGRRRLVPATSSP